MAPDGDALPERCPDCGGSMVAYTLGGADAGVCEDCGYVGIDADHTADPPERESWDDALARFYAEFGAGGDPADGPDGEVEAAGDGAAEDADDSGGRDDPDGSDGSVDGDDDGDADGSGSTDAEPAVDAGASGDATDGSVDGDGRGG